MMKRFEFESPVLRERYTKILHGSGLTVYLFPKNLTNTYCILSAAYGSMDSTVYIDGQIKQYPAGVAHFLEHKLFDNPDGSDAFEAFSALGADANAYTNYNRTAYLFSASEHLKENLSTLISFVTSPYFTAKTVKKEQGIIAEEIKMYEDNPWERCYQNLLEGLYHGNPVRENICGSVKSIQRITPEMLYECHGYFYHPANLTLVVCGRMSEEEVLSAVDSVLSDIVPPAKVQVMSKEEPRTVKTALVTDKMTVAKPLFCIGIKDPDNPADPDERLRRDAAMTLLDEILFSHSGEIYNRLFERDMVSPAFGAGYSSTDRFAFHCISGDSDQPEEVLAEILQAVEEIAVSGIDKEEFERCRRVLYADEMRAYDSTEEIANRLLSFAEDRVEMFSYPELLRTVTLEELNTLIKEVFKKEYITLSIITKKEEDQ